MIFKEVPIGFSSRFEVVSCFIEMNGEILLLHRQDNKSEGNTWGVPAGKVEAGESLEQAMIRETKEEIGISIDQTELVHKHKLFVRYPEYDFYYHIFHIDFSTKPVLTIEPKEHKDFTWVTPKKALDMELIRDEDACIQMCYSV